MSARSTEVYEQMVEREWADLLLTISPEKQNSGFGFDYFKDLMVRHGFAQREHFALLKSVFLSICSSVSRRGVKLPLVTPLDLRALIYTIRNVYVYAVVKDRTMINWKLKKS